MRPASIIVSAAFALLSITSVSSAQDGRAGRVGSRQGGQRASRAAGQQPLARELRQRFAGVVQRQLNLSDENAKRLEKVDSQFEQQRTALRREERQARLGLRAALADTANVDQAKIAQYMDQLTRGQRRRAEILESEQKELATFLTPLQRAKLQGLREQLVQRVNQIQRQNGGGRKGIQP
jgi:Spy/CpxP family protein refolding chaperone